MILSTSIEKYALNGPRINSKYFPQIWFFWKISNMLVMKGCFFPLLSCYVCIRLLKTSFVRKMFLLWWYRRKSNLNGPTEFLCKFFENHSSDVQKQKLWINLIDSMMGKGTYCSKFQFFMNIVFPLVLINFCMN